jgi:ribulose 1,5-bisphosphate synthetase/thiazole synthase
MQSRQISEDDGEAAGGLASEKAHASNWTPIMEQPVYTARKLKIVCVGAGFAGLTLAYKIKHEMKAESFLDLTIYEKNHGNGSGIHSCTLIR